MARLQEVRSAALAKGIQHLLRVIIGDNVSDDDCDILSQITVAPFTAIPVRYTV